MNVNAGSRSAIARRRLLNAGKQLIDAAMAAFPKQRSLSPSAGNGHVGATGNLDPTAIYVAENAIANAASRGPAGSFSKSTASRLSIPPRRVRPDSAWNLLWNSQPDVGAQMVY